MSVVFDSIGIITLLITLILFGWASRSFAFEALSLPCVTYMTTIIYFYIMPFFFVAGGGDSWFGLSMTNLDSVHLAGLVYTLGATAAFFVTRQELQRDPVEEKRVERAANMALFWALTGIGVLAILTKIWLGQITLINSEDVTFSEATENLNFLNLGHSMLIGLSIFYLIRRKFNLLSVLYVAGVVLIFVIEGSRFRLVIMATAVIIAYAGLHSIRIRSLYVLTASVAAIVLMNAIGLSRTYGRGLDLTNVEGMSWQDLFQAFGGEVGPVFVLMHVTAGPPPLIYFEPWVNAVARFVPAFLWPGKPGADYLLLYVAGFPDSRAASAGIAATQHTEFLLQFGWIGLPILAFLFFRIATFLVGRFHRLGRDGRVAGCAIIPTLFGFYAQQRGYTFQVVSEVLFTLAPIFLLYAGSRATAGISRMRRDVQ
jgi:hypothetical protein